MPDFSWLGPPIDARPLFTPERSRLLELLRDLDPIDWREESVPGWTVRDLAAHVLGDDYGRISRDRDHHDDGPPLAPGETLETFIHRTNQQWVDAAARISPAALTETLEMTGNAISALWEQSDPDGRSLGVSWAGADPAPLWLDCARDLTEYWTHRQQIRHAVGRPTDHDPRLLAPVLDTFMRALPHTMRAAPAQAATQVQVVVDGPAGGTWAATCTGLGWSLAPEPVDDPAAVVHLDAETAWLLCTRGIEPDVAIQRSRLEGDRELAEAACQILSIIR
ncbi:maleylpyruvate isomerase family mycothiol-dependent enzyme [Saccharopolyspora erythraea]|uniref:maleylpyruvate isomerase family mycothiol-dependent enzyme n=1 Tax=Saccharopolyspora erythraea TaxID=1836 RepID=UPI001BAB9B8C|nr:maleylpyruvate isomerase family mycothiol-dependent enzyme [Saccharopolyspora erythraea]QUH01786.1 maleylpyruvate isomerase family mycothiol-dependent enzyme [Saccharopolyspora erythraea]